MRECEQIEDFLQIIHCIDLQYPLQRLGGWAASADFMKIVYREILAKLQKKENICIVECGSGVSTVLISYLLKEKSNNATFFSLEHNIDYAMKTKNELENHKVSDYNTILFAPLIKYKIDDSVWYWYKIDELKQKVDTIDILIVDGPPMNIQSQARYPAIPILKSLLHEDAVIILDDAKRNDEQITLFRWQQELQFFDEEFIHTEKGTSIIKLRDFQKKPKITIAIPTYNRPQFLQQAIQSCMEQIYKNFEIVIVDDGSEYNVEDIVKQFNDPRIRFIKNSKNMGRSYTRNRCVEYAQGEYILWLDDDDVLLSDTLINYVRLLNNYDDIDVVYGKLKILEGERLFIDPFDYYANSLQLANALLLEGCRIPNPGTMVKKSIYEQYGGYDTRFLRAQDYEFWSRIALDVTFKKCDKVVVEYRIHENNISAGEKENIDNSYESLIIRKMIKEQTFYKIFYYENSINSILYQISNTLTNYFDMCNSIFYGFEQAIEESDQKEIYNKVMNSLKMDNIFLAEYLLQHLQNNDIPKKLITQYKKIKKKIERAYKLSDFNRLEEYIEILEKNFSANKISLFYKAILALHQNRKEIAKKKAISCFVMNPFSQETMHLLHQLGVDNIEDIYKRITEEVNFLEKEKNSFIEKYMKEVR